jgi:GxxExxY protein
MSPRILGFCPRFSLRPLPSLQHTQKGDSPQRRGELWVFVGAWGELSLPGIPFQQQKSLPVVYKGTPLDCGYRLNFLVADMIVVAVKAIDALLPIHQAQLLSYLKLGGWKLGLLINFHVPLLRDGIKRVVLGLEELSD